MSKLQDKYKEFKSKQSDYLNRRRELLREPEEKLADMAEDIGVHIAREEVEKLLKKKLDRAWRLYNKIWKGEPTDKDVDKFLALADEIISYDDFITKENLRVWQVTRDLVWSFKEAFKGTQDEFDQQEIQ